MKHLSDLSDYVLKKFINEDLPEDEQVNWLQHYRNCKVCREYVKENENRLFTNDELNEVKEAEDFLTEKLSPLIRKHQKKR